MKAKDHPEAGAGEPQACARCGGPLGGWELAGLCPACLLAEGEETHRETSQPIGKELFTPPSPADLKTLFPQLELLGLLGAGGMGAVYKARQPALDRVVALKILPGEGGAAGTVAAYEERFNREARALARLNHPNIVAVYEFGRAGAAGELHYFLMEYVDGTNLRQLERAGRLSPREALQIIPQICDALQYAHDEGVVHRDIKPENVLIDRKGRVKIADFGLAKIMATDPSTLRLTVEGQVMGTPHYMAPEQIERPLGVDHRADIYSLGVVFYEMLTGDLPLGKFAPPSRKVQVDVRLDEVVLRALENDPARRYQSASEVKSSVASASQAAGLATRDAGDTVSSPETASGAGNADVARGPRAVEHRYWAGVPVVVVRDGEPEISWNGLLGVIAQTAAVMCVGFLLLWATTGERSPGGHTPRIATLAAAILVMGGIRRLMAEDYAEWAAGWRRHALARWLGADWPKRRGHFALACLFCLILGYGNYDHARRQAMSAAGRPAAVEAGVPAYPEVLSDGTWVARVPGGGRVELVAVGDTAAAPDGWWRPDGRLATGVTYEVRDVGSVLMDPALKRDLIFRTNDLPLGVRLVSVDFEPAAHTGHGGEVVCDNVRWPGAFPVRAAWELGTTRVAARVGFIADDWRVLSTHDPVTRSGRFMRQPGDPEHPGLHAASATPEGTQATFALAGADLESRLRFTAVDRNGQLHEATSETSSRLAGAVVRTVGFRGMALADIRQLQVEIQRIRWARFPGIAVVPAGPVPPPQPWAFGGARQVTFEALFDLDRGVAGDFPAGRPGAHPLEGMGDNLAWMQEAGFDIEARGGTLGLVGMRVVYLDPHDWDRLDPVRLGSMLGASGRMPGELSPPRAGLPATVGFRTREGSAGLLQVLAYAADRPGVTLRYKLATRGEVR